MKIRHILRRMLIWGLLWVSAIAAVAQTAQQQTGEPKANEAESSAQPEPAPADKKRAEEFIPSEEISADRAVSFPVDI